MTCDGGNNENCYGLPMMDLMESSAGIRRSLNDYLLSIKKLDPLPKQRAETERYKRRLIRTYGPRCGFDGKTYNLNELEAAHIIPLEVGADTNLQNLILLCRSCHKHYDRGYVSISAMSKIAEEWRSGFEYPILRCHWNEHPISTPNKSSLSWSVGHPRPPPPSSVWHIITQTSVMHRHCQFLKASKLITRTLAEEPLSHVARIYLMITRADLTRRRAAHGAVRLALDFLNAIVPADVPLRYRSFFYYELGYIHRLLGEHQRAAEFMRASAASVGHGALAVENYVSIASNEIASEIALNETLDRGHARYLENRLNEIKSIAMSSGSAPGYEEARICARLLVQVRLKAGDRTGTWEALQWFRTACYDQDITTGWEGAARQEFAQTAGLVHVIFPSSDDELCLGIGLLARAFMTRLGSRQRPEGIRDVGFGLAAGLRKQRQGPKMDKIAQALETALSRTVDGTSELWPWHADG
jgi:HNH endonuclease